HPPPRCRWSCIPRGRPPRPSCTPPPPRPASAGASDGSGCRTAAGCSGRRTIRVQAGQRVPQRLAHLPAGRLGPGPSLGGERLDAGGELLGLVLVVGVLLEVALRLGGK